MNRFLWLLMSAGALAPCPCFGAIPPVEPAFAPSFAVHSRSGQFLVRASRGSTPTLAQPLQSTNSSFIALAPESLAVSAERVKAALLRELDLPDRWQGRIQLTILPRYSQITIPRVVSGRFADGWLHACDLPPEMDRLDLARTLVQTLLTEIANRQAGPYPPEIPLWLAEALASRILATAGPDPIVQDNPLLGKFGNAIGQVANQTRYHVGVEDWSTARAWLISHPPLNFTQLSLPPPEALVGDALRTYRLSARLLLTELQHLPRGKQCLSATVLNLTRSLNWQTAMLIAFRPHFERLLDLEKWWGLACADFLLGSQPLAWSRAVVLDKLTDILDVHVEARDSPPGPGRTLRVPLQRLIAEPNAGRYRGLIRTRLGQLQALRKNTGQDMISLVSDYIGALQAYLSGPRPPRGASTAPGSIATAAAVLTRDTLRRLDELDHQRHRLAQATPAVQAPDSVIQR
ncbi:MAG TPA: hypothetical protein PKM73_07750 [Verrucomicrobiota bacterium]|nr:hypothetical protein [Verrucomicrobiota bacterium]HNU51218.1 hypothetical protein [Verrucomicrobiota bacterium]